MLAPLVPARPPPCSDLMPDPNGVSCYAHFNATPSMPSYVERDGKWHHLAVTWTQKDNGLTQVCACVRVSVCKRAVDSANGTV